MAVARKQTHPMQSILETGSKPVGKAQPRNSVKVVDMQPTLELKGVQLAERVIDSIINEGKGLSAHFRDMLTLSDAGREAFRKTVAASMGRRVDSDGNPIEPDAVESQARRSARTRLSEFTTISKALDLKLIMKPEWTFWYAVGQARAFLRSQAAHGETRGRKAASADEKIANYLSKQVATVKGGWDHILELVQELADKAEEEKANAKK